MSTLANSNGENAMEYANQTASAEADQGTEIGRLNCMLDNIESRADAIDNSLAATIDRLTGTGETKGGNTVAPHSVPGSSLPEMQSRLDRIVKTLEQIDARAERLRGI